MAAAKLALAGGDTNTASTFKVAGRVSTYKVKHTVIPMNGSVINIPHKVPARRIKVQSIERANQ